MRRSHGVTGRRPVTPLKKSHTCFAHCPTAPIAPHRPADLMGHLPRAQTGSTSPNCDRDTPRPVPKWQLAPPAPRMRAGPTDRPTRPLHAPERSHTELVRSPTAAPPRKTTRRRLTARRPHGVTGRRPVTPLKKSHTCFPNVPAPQIAPHPPPELMRHLSRAQTGSTSPNSDRE